MIQGKISGERQVNVSVVEGIDEKTMKLCDNNLVKHPNVCPADKNRNHSRGKALYKIVHKIIVAHNEDKEQAG